MAGVDIATIAPKFTKFTLVTFSRTRVTAGGGAIAPPPAVTLVRENVTSVNLVNFGAIVAISTPAILTSPTLRRTM